MAQITSGIRSLLSIPTIYSAFQVLMGVRGFREEFVPRHVRPMPGMRVLDIGCGPADILEYLPSVEYWGYDISEAYIAQARRRFGAAARFFCKQLETSDLVQMPRFDLVLATGLLHHLDDEVARLMMQMGHEALAPGGRLLTVDPCLDAGQHPVAKLLVKNDRGQNVRTREGYESLARTAFPQVRATVRHQAWIPYTHCIMECSE